jgi:uncharacterized metal-binding protein
MNEEILEGNPNKIAFLEPKNHVFRKAYRELTDQEKKVLETIKDKAFELYSIIADVTFVPKNRESSLALTHLEQSVMWAVEAITG